MIAGMNTPLVPTTPLLVSAPVSENSESRIRVIRVGDLFRNAPPRTFCNYVSVGYTHLVATICGIAALALVVMMIAAAHVLEQGRTVAQLATFGLAAAGVVGVCATPFHLVQACWRFHRHAAAQEGALV